MMRTALWAFALAILTSPAVSHAALTATLQPSNQTFLFGENASGSFEIFVTGTGGDMVSGSAIALDIAPPDSGVTFNTATAVSNASAAPNGYIFDTRGLLLQFPSTTSHVEYIDGFLNGATFKTVNAGQVYGAGTVFFEVAAGTAPGVYTFNFDETISQFRGPTPGQTLIDTTFVGGTITILPAGVPEPSTTLLLGLTGVVGFGVTRLRKRRHTSATTAA